MATETITFRSLGSRPDFRSLALYGVHLGGSDRRVGQVEKTLTSGTRALWTARRNGWISSGHETREAATHALLDNVAAR